MTEKLLEETLRSMGPDVAASDVEAALDLVHDRSRRRRRHRTGIRAAIGSAAAAAVIVGGLAVIDPDDSGQPVIADQPTTTVPDHQPTTAPEPETTTPPVVRTLDDLDIGVVGIELTTWYGTVEDWRGLWRVDDDLAGRVVEALERREPAAVEPANLGRATMRLELADGSVVLTSIDLETGWVESEITIGEELAREVRHAFDDAVASPWVPVDLDEPDSSVARLLAEAPGPWPSPEAALDALLDAAREIERSRLEEWFGPDHEVDEGTDPMVGEVMADGSILLRNIDGDDSVRGPHHRVWLASSPDGWSVDRVESRWLCQRSVPNPPDHLCA